MKYKVENVFKSHVHQSKMSEKLLYHMKMWHLIYFRIPGWASSVKILTLIRKMYVHLTEHINPRALVYFLGCVWLFCDPMHGSPPGSSVMGLSRQEYWSGLPCPPPGVLSDPGIKPESSALQADSLSLNHQGNSLTQHNLCQFSSNKHDNFKIKPR